MEVLPVSYMPGDPMLIDKIVCELKSQGIFDSFRKECISDVDTKPAYQNLRQRVEGSVAGFLRKQKWRPDMNKNQVREMLRKNIYESGFLETGVERIVDQVVNPKMNTVFLPKVTDVVYKYLGIERPTTDMERRQERCEISIENLLPKDLEAVSPESEPLDRRDDKLDDSYNLDDCKMEEDESPPFEPIDEQIFNEENSVDSHLSGFSGLVSHDSNQSDGQRPLQIDMDTQMSKQSSDGRSSLVMNEDQNSKMEISEDSRLDSNSKGFEVDSSDKSSGSVKLENPADKDKKEERVDKKEERVDKKEDKRDDRKDRHRSDRHRSRTESRSDKKDDKRSDRDRKDKYSSKDKDRKDDKSRSDRDKDRHKSSSSKHSNSHDKSSSKKESSKSDSKHRSESKDKKEHKERHDSTKDKVRDKPYSKDSKSRDDKSRSHTKPDNKDRKSSTSSNSNSRRDKDKKDPKKRAKDDHYSSKHRPERRSTDRDSNDGSGLKSSSSSYSESNSSSQNSTTQVNKPPDSSTSNSNDSGNSDATEHRQPVTLSSEDLNNSGEFLISIAQNRRLIKPKIASNIQEARRLMKIRKQLKKIEKQSGIALDALNRNLSQRAARPEQPKVEPVPEPEPRPITPPPSISVSMATWDALEAKLNESVNFDTYYDPEVPVKVCGITVTETLKKEIESIKSLEAKYAGGGVAKAESGESASSNSAVDIKETQGFESDDCLYFPAESVTADESCRKGFTDSLIQLEREINELESKIALSICNNVPTADAEELNKENKRIGMKRKISDKSDNLKKMRNNNNLIDVTTHEEKFSLPLSPSDSDKSVDKRNDSDGQIPKQKRQNKISKAQRYSSEDLYKPRPFIKRSSSRRGDVKLD